MVSQSPVNLISRVQPPSPVSLSSGYIIIIIEREHPTVLYFTKHQTLIWSDLSEAQEVLIFQQ